MSSENFKDLINKYNTEKDEINKNALLLKLKKFQNDITASIKELENKVNSKNGTISETTPVNVQFSEKHDETITPTTPVDIEFDKTKSEKPDETITPTSPVPIHFDKSKDSPDSATLTIGTETEARIAETEKSNETEKGTETEGLQNLSEIETEKENKGISTESEAQLAQTDTNINMSDIDKSFKTKTYDPEKASIIYISSVSCPACVRFQPIWDLVKKDLNDAHYVFELDANSEIARKFNFRYTPAIYHLFKGFVNELYMKSVNDLKDDELDENEYKLAMKNKILENS